MSANPRKPWTARRIHLWVATLFALPMTLMAVSGVLISIRTLSDIKVPMSWMSSETVPDRLPITAYAETADRRRWIGNAQGLWVVSGGQSQAVDAFSGQAIVGLAVARGQSTPIVATSMALWSGQDGPWQVHSRGRVRQIGNLADGRVFAVAGGRGEMANGRALSTEDGINWTPYGPAMQANKSLPAIAEPRVALQQWMRELHSGAYFFGKGKGEIGWGNAMAWTLALLSLTGLWIWWRSQRRTDGVAQRAPAARRRAPSTDGATAGTQPAGEGCAP